MGIGFAIPVSTGRQVLEGLVKDGHITRGWIGVEPQDLTPEIASALGLKQSSGVVITGLLKNGPAASAGLQPGDIVESIAGQPVPSVSELLSQVSGLKPGAPAQFGVIRNGDKIQLKVTPGSRPAVKPKR
jgi:serine protease DegQ